MTVRELLSGVFDVTCRDDDRGRYRAFLFDAALVSHGSSVLGEAHRKLDAFVNFSGKES